MRTFFACLPTPEVALEIDKWRALNWPLLERPVPPQNLHMTLVFTGDINQSQLQCMHEALLGLESPGFHLNFDRTGFFNKADILWLGMHNQPDRLPALVSALRVLCLDCGVQLKKRDYIPHVTLARRCGHLPSIPLVEPSIGFYADSIHLMISEQAGGMVTYRSLISRQLD